MLSQDPRSGEGAHANRGKENKECLLIDHKSRDHNFACGQLKTGGEQTSDTDTVPWRDGKWEGPPKPVLIPEIVDPFPFLPQTKS